MPSFSKIPLIFEKSNPHVTNCLEFTDFLMNPLCKDYFLVSKPCENGMIPPRTQDVN